MGRAPDWYFVAGSVGLAALLCFAVASNLDPHLFEKRSPAVTLTGIDRTLVFEGSAHANVTGPQASGCPSCPLRLAAGSTKSVWVGMWNASVSGGGQTVYLNWTVSAPFPFQALAYTPPTPPLVHSWSENDQIGPYGGGGFGFSLTFVIPYSYSDLPASGNVTFTMVVTQVGGAAAQT